MYCRLWTVKFSKEKRLGAQTKTHTKYQINTDIFDDCNTHVLNTWNDST